MLQFCFEQLSLSSAVWHFFPQPVARRLSATQLYSEPLQTPTRKREEGGRGEGRKKGRKGGRKGVRGEMERKEGRREREIKMKERRERVSSNQTNMSFSS